MKLFLNERATRRIVSFIVAFAIAFTAVPFSIIMEGLFPLFSFKSHADSQPPYEPTYSAQAEEFSGNTINLSNVTLLVDYSLHYSRNTDGFAYEHKNDTLVFAFTGVSDISENFAGLGTSEYPFGGTLRFGGANYQINAHRALFNYVYDSVELLNSGDSSQETVVFRRLSAVGDGESKPLFADHVRHDTREGKTPAQWQILLSSQNVNTYSGVIGEIESDAAVTLNYTNNSDANVASNAGAGAICGTMQSGASLYLSYNCTNSFGVTSSAGNAGGLVGSMNGNASLTIDTLPALSYSVTAYAYSGGLVGKLTSEATITNLTGAAFTVGGTINGNLGSGGIFGHYTNYTTEFDLSNYNNTATVDGKYCGGVFGVLENNKGDSESALALTIKNTGNAGILSVNSGTSGNSNGSFGGIAGQYTTDDLENSLVLDGLTLTANANAAYSAFGGAIGMVDSVAYIATAGTVTVQTSGTALSSCFGGLVGATAANAGVFVDLGNFTLTNNSEQFKGGGIVGRFENGVLRLSGTTDLSGAKSACAENCGQIIGKNNNVLVYAPENGNASGWTFNRSNSSMADDLGTWGEVVRVADIETDVLTYDSSAHTVTVGAAVSAMGSQSDFARTALNIQLNQGSDYDCLKFTSGSNTRADLLNAALSLTADIDLSGTGINGFMRDGGDVSKIGSFTGTLDGGSHTVTLAIGETYGNGAAGQTEGMGQIYRHQHNGLFSVLAGTVKDITVDGTINVRNSVDGVNENGAAAMNIGGIASRNGGNVTLSGVHADETVNYHENNSIQTQDSHTPDKNIGGFIGYIGSNGTITVNGKSSIGASFNLSGHHESWNVYGGAIGKVTAETFAINIGVKDDPNNKLTNGLKMDVSGITNTGANSDGGGLIGYITDAGSYGTRIVNIGNLEYDGCKLENTATTNGGGLFGYSWLNTTASIDGLTVTNAVINNRTTGNATGGNSNVGVICYSATGKWIVNSLAVNGLTVSGGCDSSLGLMVNKAYDGNKGLYLDVLNAGYTLNGSGITLPNPLSVYDEFAAHSASNVISGGNGTGVISIDMNSSRAGTATKITETGTYQNQLSSQSAKYANSSARYYYNLNHMSSNVGGQNLLLWSLNKYAASNIKGEFVSTLGNTLSGTADMTGLSFYPLASANGNYTVGDLTLTFDYSGIYTTAETVTSGDGYIRDPGASNQHYLMHSGLFIDQPSGNILTLSGALSLGGTFMEDSTHSGVIFSGTMRGKFISGDNSEIKLDGIKPMTTGGAAYSDGYLLINNITRASDLENAPEISIKNLYTTNKYSTPTYTAGGTNAKVAKSLMGAAVGKDLTVKFSHIKLDARDGSKYDVKLENLYNAYGTYNSIFKTSTLLASIRTNQNATLEYNYTYDEDWGTGDPRYVTYGKEVKDSSEYAGQENKYYGDTRRYTNPLSNADTEYNFSTGFLKYVAADYNRTPDSNGLFSRELKVNVMTEGLTVGCGTYNDPYIITDGEVLESVAAFIANGNTSDLSAVRLPKDYTSYDTLSENTAGSRWCNDDDAVYKPNNAGTGYESDEAGAVDWTAKVNVQYYLANAYYVINADIELSDTFLGLGGKTANTAFRGVIVGIKNGDGTPRYTVTNKSDNPFINVSNGCVIKDINIQIAKNISLNQTTNSNTNAYFGYDSRCAYYGGIIGEVMGGDNIIDNSYVTYNNSTITLTGTYGTIVPVGGYVGVIVFGGVIFKNMTASKTTVDSTHLRVVYTGKSENLADNDKVEDWAAIYVNPIVGRVINGYAVNETEGTGGRFSTSEDGKYHDDNGTTRTGAVIHSLKNGTKHYTIADINKDDTNKLDVAAIATSGADGTINVPNAQALFILSLITQSGAGTAGSAHGAYISSLSYGTNGGSVYGMSHNATYNDVGTNDATSSDYSTYAISDTADNTAIPYIIRHYTEGGTQVITTVKTEKFTGEPDGGVFKIGNERNGANSPAFIYKGEVNRSNRWHVYGTTSIDEASDIHIEKVGEKYVLYYEDNGSRKYLYIATTSDAARGSLRISDELTESCYFTIELKNNSWWSFKGNTGTNLYINFRGIDLGFASYNGQTDSGSQIFLYKKTSLTTIINDYPARYVTSTEGYYDINLTGSGTYQLPDSFRGLGSVGMYDTAATTASKYSIKLSTFDGNGRTIDQDIYLNKFYSDNYFNVLHEGGNQTLNSGTAYDIDSQTANHGIGLFDSVIMKSGGKFYNFTLKGSVKTAMFSNAYSDAQKEYKGVPASGTLLWHSTGGVCGWSRGNQELNFNSIALDNLIINGSNYVGGLLAHSGNNTNSLNVTVTECSANEISLTMAASQTSTNPRNAMGAFVGKVKQGKVVVYGTSSGANNTNSATQSEVTIKSFSLGNDTQNFRISIGGLVGYSGHGFEAYDMYVTSSDSKGTTIGNSYTGICGGIIGVMQPYSSGNENATAIFKNCTVENINVQGDMAGGIYGGKWTGSDWVPYRIEMINCNVEGKSSSAKNNITGGGYAGGLVGNGLVFTRKSTSKDDANIIISDCKVSNYNIVSNTNGYSGGFVGYCDSRQQSITCYIHDSSVEDCVIGQSGTKDYAGGAIGGIAKKADNRILGYNIKLDNVTSPGSRMGAWVGYMATDDETTSIQFTGMAIYGTGYDKNIGNWTVENNQKNTKASFVFADYTGKCNDMTSDEENVVSGYNYSEGSHVEMPKYPYVNINPQSGMGADAIISGDGAALFSSSMTMAAKIYSDLGDTSNTRRYTTFSDSAVYGSNGISYYLNRAAGSDGDRISTYLTEKGSLPDGVSDFAVIVIANQTNEETTNLINRYIQLVTNTTNDYTLSNDYYNIAISTCKYEGGRFVIDTSATDHGLVFTQATENASGSFALDNAHADSAKVNTFTLVDVQFNDPLEPTKIAYHLYVPVYTIRQMEVNFYSAVKTGSHSVSYNNGDPSTDYSALMLSKEGKHVDSLETWMTQYIRYSYSATDINALLNTNNVRWSNDKEFILRTYKISTTFKRLPADTFMILVDPNGNADRMYYASDLSGFTTYIDPENTNANREGWLIELNKFKDSNDQAFSQRTFNDLIAKDIVEAETGDLLYTDGDENDHDIYRILPDGSKKYYKYADEDAGKYNLSVSNNYVLNEDYYISMYVPMSTELFFYEIKAPTELEGTKTVKVNEKNVYTVIAADLYTQTVSQLNVSPDDQQINASNKTIYVRPTVSIEISNADAKAYLSDVNLYHSFDLSLNRHSEDGVSNEIEGLDDDRITATYSIGTAADENSSGVLRVDLQNTYLNIETANIMSSLIAASDRGDPLRISAYIELDFDDSRMDEEFPQKNSEATIGVNVAATSNLAYDEDRLAYTSMSAAFDQDSHYYYIESVNSAKLDYNAVTGLDEHDTIGRESQNQSKLGVNGFSEGCSELEYMPINTQAKYNVSAISETDLAKAESLRLTVTLSKKTDITEGGVVTGVEYIQVSDLRAYLYQDILFTSGSMYGENGEGMTHTISAGSSSLVVDIPIGSCEVDSNIYTIGLDFAAKTGEDFTEYANYKITLNAELVYTENGQTKTVENSGISDYIVYTNAKVFPMVIGGL